ncbi:cupredoxin domain-containing protein [Candidatus Daviesbacteria bacterium]|nr:cupredoxin domain-containing protein [Candidatus Daviesbacteria bacterium]
MSTNTKFIAGFGIVIAVALLGWMLLSKPGQSDQVQTPAVQPQPTPTESNVKEFTVVGTPFKFEPAEIKVKLGDRVRITFKNELGMHNLTIKDLNAATKTIQKGEQDTIDFIVDKSGTFQYNCSVPTHTEKGMVGNLVVE